MRTELGPPLKHPKELSTPVIEATFEWTTEDKYEREVTYEMMAVGVVTELGGDEGLHVELHSVGGLDNEIKWPMTGELREKAMDALCDAFRAAERLVTQ